MSDRPRALSVKKIVVAMALIGVVALVATGVLMVDRFIEKYHLSRLDSSDAAVRLEAAERLAAMGSVEAIPRLLALIDASTRYEEPNVLRPRADVQATQGMPGMQVPPGFPGGGPGIAPPGGQPPPAAEPEEEEDRALVVVPPSAEGEYAMHYGSDIMCYENAELCLALVALVDSAGRAAVPSLRRAARAESNYVKYLAVALIGRLGTEASAAFPELREIVVDESIFPEQGRPDFRAEASEVLTRIIGDEAEQLVPDFLDMFCHWELPIRAAGFRGLEKAGARAVPAIVARLREGDDETRALMLEALARLGEVSAPALPRVIECLEDRDSEIRLRAIQTLAHMRGAATSAVPALERLRDDDDQDELLRDLAGQAIQWIQGATSPGPGGAPPGGGGPSPKPFAPL